MLFSLRTYMKWAGVSLIAVALILAFAVGFYFDELGKLSWGGLTGAAVQDVDENASNESRMYAWTTALCGLDRRCMDVIVECNGSQILNITPVSNIVWHTEDWEDPRGGNPGKLCN